MKSTSIRGEACYEAEISILHNFLDEYANLMLDLYEDDVPAEEIDKRVADLADRTTKFLGHDPGDA